TLDGGQLAQLVGRLGQIEGRRIERRYVVLEPLRQGLVARYLGEEPPDGAALAIADLAVRMGGGEQDVGQRAEERLLGRRRRRARTKPGEAVGARREARRRRQIADVGDVARRLGSARAAVRASKRLAGCTHELVRGYALSIGDTRATRESEPRRRVTTHCCSRD